MGRPSKTREIKEAQGTLRANRDNGPKETIPMRSGDKTPPKHLSEYGKDWFRTIHSKSEKWGTVTHTDVDAIAYGALCYDQFRKALDKYYETGEMQYDHQAGRWHDRLYRWIREYGFTPASRESVSQVKPIKDSKSLFND